MTKLRLKVGDLPNNVFIGKDFEIPLFLVDESDKLFSCREPISIDVKAQFDYSPAKPCPDGFLEVTAASSVIQKNGVGSVVVKFCGVSMNYENKRVLLYFSPRPGSGLRDIIGTTTSPLLVIRHRLIITEENKAPYTWYKDEGGKDKCIELRAHMVDADGNIVRNRKIPLKLALHYRNSSQAPQQNIMSVSPDSRLVIDEMGEAILRIRINEVSTRHQGQMFQILISPDLAQSPSAADISPVWCTPIDVKSKRNNHRDKEKQAFRQLFGGAAEPPSSSSGGGSSSSSSSNRADSDVPLKRARSDGSGTTQSSSIGSNAASIGNLFGQRALGSEASESYLDVDYVTPDGIGSAVDNLVIWTRTVMKGMEAIQWQQVGYSQNLDGSMDYSKPLFSIPNPQQAISDVVIQYSNFVKASLQYLAGAADSERQSTPSLAHGDAPSRRASGLPAQFNGSSSERIAAADASDGELLDQWVSSGLSGMGDHLSLFKVEPMGSASMDMGFSGGLGPAETETADKRATVIKDGADCLQDIDNLMESSWMAPLRLGRDISFSIGTSIEVPKLTRNHSLFLESSFPSAELNSMNGTIDFTASSLLNRSISADHLRDNNVFYILAKNFLHCNSALGLPAFDQNKCLVGFYKECSGGFDNVTYAQFTPVASVPGITPEDSSKCVSQLTDSLKLDDVAIFSLGRCGYNLDRLKEDALIFNMMNETIDDEAAS